MNKEQINIDWMYQVSPELYAKGEKYGIKGNAYMIYNKEFGLYTKKEATIICDFLRANAAKIKYN